MLWLKIEVSSVMSCRWRSLHPCGVAWEQFTPKRFPLIFTSSSSRHQSSAEERHERRWKWSTKLGSWPLFSLRSETTSVFVVVPGKTRKASRCRLFQLFGGTEHLCGNLTGGCVRVVQLWARLRPHCHRTQLALSLTSNSQQMYRM